MQTSRWDEEIQNLAAKVAQIELQVNAAKKQEEKCLADKKAALLRYQAAITKLGEKLSGFQRKKFALSPKLSALIYWAATYAEKATKLYQYRARVMGHEMWLNLVHARLTGRAAQPAGGSMIENNDLLGMAVREGNLRKVEQYLENKLLKTKLHVDQLRHRQAFVMAMESNSQAAASLQSKLGKTLTDSLQNPRYRALVAYFKWLTAAVRGTTEDEKRLQKLRQKIALRTDEVVTACRDIILTEQGVTRLSRADHGLRKLKSGLDEIDGLQAEMEGITHKVMEKLPPHPAPILMKKSTVQATRG